MGIYDGLKDAASILKEAGKIEQYQQILEAQQKMFEMQSRIGELEVDNKQLREQLATHGKLVPEGNVYWMEEGGKKDGPFCTRCWDSDRKLIRLHRSQTTSRTHCPNCDTTVVPGRAQVFRPDL